MDRKMGTVRGRSDPRQVTQSRIDWRKTAIWAPLSLLILLGGMGRASAQLDDRSYRLQVGDKIFVSVYGQPDLSAEGAVDDFGKIALPLIGPTPLNGITIAEATDKITRRYEEGFLKKALVSVRLGALRPTYILGDVRQPGAYPFTYGTTVRSLVAMSGGYGQASTAKAPNVAEYLSAEERLRSLLLEQTTLQLRRARLEAHLGGKQEILDNPGEVDGTIDRALYLKLLSAEKDKFASDNKILAAQISLIQSQRPRLQKEIDGVSGQLEVSKRELDILRTQTEQYSTTVKRGLGLAHIELDLKMGQARQEADVWRAVSQLSRLQMDMGEARVAAVPGVRGSDQTVDHRTGDRPQEAR
ncbi:polysaccharide biosynthesis/export family protein [Methylobacterium sp. P31]